MKPAVSPSPRAPDIPAPHGPLRLHPWLFLPLFAGMTAVAFVVWWGNYPISLGLFVEYWQRDKGHLIPDFGPFAGVWLENGWATLLLAAFLGAAWGLGRPAQRWIFGANPPGVWGVLLSLGLGKGILGIAVLALGLAGLLFPAPFAFLVLASCVFAFRETGGRGIAPEGIAAFLRRSPARTCECARGLGAVEWALLAAILLVVAGNFLPALEPEWFYDSLVYHMAVPEQYLLENKIWHIQHTFFSNFPFLQEMQYMLLLGLGGGVSGKLLHWWDGTASALAVFAFARLFMRRPGALLASAIFLSQPTLRFLQHVTMVELGLTLLEILATVCLARAMGLLPRAALSSLPGARTGWLFLAAWLLGFSHGTKYLGIFSSAILLGLWLFAPEKWRDKGGARKRLAGALLLVAWAALWTAPWLGKNWLFTGNPVFPMLHSVFPTVGWDGPLYEAWMRDNQKYGTGHGSLLNWLTMPLYACIDNSHFGTFTLNLFPLLFLPLVALYRGPPGGVSFLAVYSGAYFLFWAATSQQTRFLQPTVAQAAVAAAFIVVNLGKGSRPVRTVLHLASAWILVVCTWGQIHNRFTNNVLWPFIGGHMTHTDILNIGVSYYRTIVEANARVRPGDRILFLGGDESYYCRHRRLCSSIYDRSAAGQLAREAKSAEELRNMLARRRITHLLVHEVRAEEYAPRGMFGWGEKAKERFLEMWNGYGRLEFYAHGVFLFELAREKVPIDERKTGVPAYFYPVDMVRRAHSLIGAADRLFKEGRIGEAYRVSQDLVRLLPRVSFTYSYRAYAHSQRGELKAAIADYEKAIELGYPPPMVYYNLGLLLQDEKRHARALQMHLLAVRITPGLRAAREQAYDLAVRLERFALAVELGEELLAEEPGDLELASQLNWLRARAARGP